MKPYPGSKAGAGVAERIIRQMPPHQVYVELFAGSANVFFRKRPAEYSVLVDEDPSTCQALTSAVAGRGDVDVVCCHYSQFLVEPGKRVPPPASRLIYADPPYLRKVRTRLFYRKEFASGIEHASLLSALLEQKCMVMISGYWSDLYASMLADWRLVRIPTMTRGGPREECLWCNFPEPTLIHDPRFAGGDFRERERIKRKQRRWASRFAAMQASERQAVAEALVESDRVTVEMAMRTGSPLAVTDPDVREATCDR
jgi:16S rRNA G966 N2-methylase RsmD